jgi:hypothetical protein
MDDFIVNNEKKKHSSRGCGGYEGLWWWLSRFSTGQQIQTAYAAVSRAFILWNEKFHRMNALYISLLTTKSSIAFGTVYSLDKFCPTGEYRMRQH